MSTPLQTWTAGAVARATWPTLPTSLIPSRTGVAFSSSTAARRHHLPSPTSPPSLSPVSLSHPLSSATRRSPALLPRLSAGCRRCFSLSSMTDLKFKADISSNTTKPINIGGIKHDNTTRRFYDKVDVAYRPAAAADPTPSGWVLTLAGRHVHTPAGHPLVVPTQRLALAIAVEWESQLAVIKYTTMPLTGLALTAIDRVRPDPAAFTAKFYDPDVLVDNALVRVDEPATLVQLQKKHFDPLLRHLSAVHAIDLQPTSDFGHPPATSHTGRLGAILAAQDEWTLVAIGSVASVSRSLIVALAFLEGRLSVEEAYEACRVEENYQMRRHGIVRGVFGHTTDIEYTQMTLAAARTLLNLIHPPLPSILTIDNSASSNTPNS